MIYQYNNNAGLIIVPTILIVLVSLAVISLFSNQSVSSNIVILEEPELTIEEIKIIQSVSKHAWEIHGEQVDQSIDCLSKKGSLMSFKTSGFRNRDGSPLPTNTWICQDGDDLYGIVTTVFETVKGNKYARLITAYKVARDSYPTLSNYVEYLITNWNAIQIDYIFQAGKIILK